MNGANPGRQSTGRWHQRLHSFKWVKTLWLAIAISGTWTCHGAPVEPNGITTCEKLAVERNSLGRRMSIQRLVIAGTTDEALADAASDELAALNHRYRSNRQQRRSQGCTSRLDR